VTQAQGCSWSDVMLGTQICYLLGASGHSWVVDYGYKPPKRPHHRDAALTMAQSGDWNVFNSSAPSPNVLSGALVGGPLEDGSWSDDRQDYIGNEVALDYNAALIIGAVQCAASSVPALPPAIAKP
jgi:Glycosyl hydrolase family 9